MRRLLSFLIVVSITIMLVACGGDSGTGPDPDNDNEGNGGEETTTYTVDVSADDGGSVSPSGSNEYDEGETAELTADPNDEYLFSGWTGDVESEDNPLSLTVEQDYSLTANFEKKTYALTTKKEGEGAIDETVIEQKATDYESGTVVELTANPAEGYKFVGWKGDLTGTENPRQITVDNPKEVTAVFEKKTYALATNTEGDGAIEEKVVQEKSTDYKSGTVVELTANPADGYKFVEWKGDLSGTDNPAQITVDSPKEVTAVFSQFYRASNGVTIKCDSASLGDTGTVDGTEYTKRSKDQITPNNATTTCTSGITDMEELFRDEDTFNEDISHWDVSSVGSMREMFRGAGSFNRDLGSWDVSSVADMWHMFRGAGSFNKNIGGWDVSNVTSMRAMFLGANSFNGDLNNWDVSSVTDMRHLFSATDNFNGEIGGWDVSSVTDMTGMFQFANRFAQDISSWCVEQIGSKPSDFDTNAGFEGDESYQPNWGDPCSE